MRNICICDHNRKCGLHTADKVAYYPHTRTFFGRVYATAQILQEGDYFANAAWKTLVRKEQQPVKLNNKVASLLKYYLADGEYIY